MIKDKPIEIQNQYSQSIVVPKNFMLKMMGRCRNGIEKNILNGHGTEFVEQTLTALKKHSKNV